MAGMNNRTPPPDLTATFDSAKAHYETFSGPKTIADIFNFNIEEKPTTPPPDAPTTPETPATNNTVEIALDGGKTEKIEAKAEDVAAFNSIKTSAEVILGSKEAGVGDQLKQTYNTQKDAYDAAGDKKPEEGGKILKTVADTLVKNITTKTKLLDKKLIGKDKEANLADDKLKDYTLVGLENTLKIYLPLAFEGIYKRTDETIDKKTNITTAAKELLKKSLIGHLRGANETGYKTFADSTKDGYEKVVARILKQEEILTKLQGDASYWTGMVSGNNSPLNIA